MEGETQLAAPREKRAGIKTEVSLSPLQIEKDGTVRLACIQDIPSTGSEINALLTVPSCGRIQQHAGRTFEVLGPCQKRLTF